MLSQEPETTAERPRRRRGLTVVVVIAVALLLTLRGVATLWTDFLWYSSVGLTSVWRVQLFTRIALVVAASLVAFAVLWINLIVTQRISPRLRLLDIGMDDEVVQRFQDWVEPRLRRVQLGLAAVFGVLVGLGAAAWRDNVLLFVNRRSFGIADPIHDLDVGFYVFRLPFYRDIFNWSFQLVLLTVLIVAGLHYLNGGIRLQRGRGPYVAAKVKAHLSVLLAVLALLKAVGYRLDTYELLYSPRGYVFGAGFTDVQARLPALNLLALISLLAVVLLVWNIWRRGWLLPAAAVGSWLVVSIVVGGIIPAAIQRFQVDPSEFDKEAEYIAHNIEFTRAAYGLDEVEVRQFAASDDLASADIEANEPTIANIRLWDPTVLKRTYSQLQEIRSYYQLDNVDVDRYRLDGKLTQVMIATRELDEDSLPAGGWLNEHLVYTHGFGAVLSPANEVIAQQGQPAFLVQDVPPVSVEPELEIAQPRIYFGETYEPNDFVIVGTNQEELDFPLTAEGQSFASNTYDGAGGVPMGDVLRRAAFALRFGDLNSLISSELTGRSKVLMVRNVRERVQKAAPFLYPDNDPYMVLIDGRLVWMVDLYTISGQYPYSTPAGFEETRRLARSASLPVGFNYIRNSVKATVDAYDGTMRFHVIDDTDPLLDAYRRIYPNLFESGDVPEAFREHFRYPEDLFRIQSDMYRDYHMNQAPEFYSSEDAWEIPQDPSTKEQDEELLRGDRSREAADRLGEMLPYYLLMRLPDEEEESYLILQPFNPQDKPNMASFLIAKSDPGSYGELIDYRLPRERFIDGPAQVSTRINQDTSISQQFTLWDQQGSNVIQGNMLVVPIEESVVYFQPIYLEGEQNPLPEFKQVVVVFQESIVMAETLDEALTEVFGGTISRPDGGPSTPSDGPLGIDSETEQLLREAEAKAAEAQVALQAGDLGRYQELNEEVAALLQQVLERLQPGTGA